MHVIDRRVYPGGGGGGGYDGHGSNNKIQRMCLSLFSFSSLYVLSSCMFLFCVDQTTEFWTMDRIFSMAYYLGGSWNFNFSVLVDGLFNYLQLKYCVYREFVGWWVVVNYW